MSILDRIRHLGNDEHDAEETRMETNDVMFGEETDEFDDFDDALSFDEMGGDESDAGVVAELENKIDELESELGRLSSTVPTVRSENKEISETVERTEENVRKLLDVYEMVTRGINPFVDDVEPGTAFDGAGFSLFSSEESTATESDDESIASADAESFFDDDLLDGGTTEETTDVDGSTTEIDDDSVDAGLSFEELKREYSETGEPAAIPDERSDGPNRAPVAGAHSTPVAVESAPTADVREGDAATVEGDPSDGSRPEPPAEPVDDGVPADVAPALAEFDAPVDDAQATSPSEADRVFAENTILADDHGTKPYLTALPDGYVSDLIVMEWLEYLVERSDLVDAYRSIAYYETIEWIDDSMGDELRRFLYGFGEAPADAVTDDHPVELDLDDHTRSLQYISQLTSATSETVLLNDWIGQRGGDRGAR